jgi:hypothetical protein
MLAARIFIYYLPGYLFITCLDFMRYIPYTGPADFDFSRKYQ